MTILSIRSNDCTPSIWLGFIRPRLFIWRKISKDGTLRPTAHILCFCLIVQVLLSEVVSMKIPSRKISRAASGTLQFLLFDVNFGGACANKDWSDAEAKDKRLSTVPARKI